MADPYLPAMMGQGQGADLSYLLGDEKPLALGYTDEDYAPGPRFHKEDQDVDKGRTLRGPVESSDRGTEELHPHDESTGRGGNAAKTIPAVPLGNGRRPHPRQLSSRFRFWPAAISSASPLTFS